LGLLRCLALGLRLLAGFCRLSLEIDQRIQADDADISSKPQVGWLVGSKVPRSIGCSGSASIERKIALDLPTCQCPCQ
jgi:hypothetical protein